LQRLYQISVQYDDRQRAASGQRAVNGVVSLHVPTSVIKAKSALYMKRGKGAVCNVMARSTTCTRPPNRVGNYVTPQVGNYVIANPALAVRECALGSPAISTWIKELGAARAALIPLIRNELGVVAAQVMDGSVVTPRDGDVE
jgi:hypothetical protein